MHWLNKIWLYARTLRYLKPIQITNRIKRKIFPAKVDMSDAPSQRLIDRKSFHYIGREASILGDDKFHFLNREETLSFPQSWNDTD